MPVHSTSVDEPLCSLGHSKKSHQGCHLHQKESLLLSSLSGQHSFIFVKFVKKMGPNWRLEPPENYFRFVFSARKRNRNQASFQPWDWGKFQDLHLPSSRDCNFFTFLQKAPNLLP